MSGHFLLNLLNELGKNYNLMVFYRFFAIGLINSIIQET